MTNYQKVLVELDKNSSIKAQYNNLVKILYSTEDRQLKFFINSWLNVLDNAEHYRVRNLPNHVIGYLNENSHVKQNLIDYCNDIIRTSKPEWQILAEKHGWKPPV